MKLKNLLKELPSNKIKHLGTILSITWAVYLVIHMLLTGKLWLWNLTSFIPPFIFLSLTIILFIKNIAFRNVVGLLIILLISPLAYVNSDMNLNLSKRSFQTINYKKQITIFNWNTEFWETDRTEELYEFLQTQNADIYQLQEHYSYEDDKRNKFHLSDDQEIRKYFPEYNIVAKDEFLTLSKYPIIESFADREGTYLKTEIDIEGQIIIFYNVHIPLQTYYPLISYPAKFLEDLKKRFYLRESKFDILEQEIEASQNLFYISGDFNTTKAMGKMGYLLSKTTDSYSTTNILFPRTWKILGLKLWRIDYNLASKGIEIISHENVDSKGFSDHSGQKVTIGI